MRFFDDFSNMLPILGFVAITAVLFFTIPLRSTRKGWMGREIPRYKSLTIAAGVISIVAAFLFSYSQNFCFERGHFFLAALGGAMITVGFFFKEEKLYWVATACIVFNSITALSGFFKNIGL